MDRGFFAVVLIPDNQARDEMTVQSRELNALADRCSCWTLTGGSACDDRALRRDASGRDYYLGYHQCKWIRSR